MDHRADRAVPGNALPAVPTHRRDPSLSAARRRRLHLGTRVQRPRERRSAPGEVQLSVSADVHRRRGNGRRVPARRQPSGDQRRQSTRKRRVSPLRHAQGHADRQADVCAAVGHLPCDDRPFRVAGVSEAGHDPAGAAHPARVAAVLPSFVDVSERGYRGGDLRAC